MAEALHTLPAPMREALDYIPPLEQHMVQLTHDFAAINSGSYHVAGLARMAALLERQFYWLSGTCEMLDLPPHCVPDNTGTLQARPLGQCLRITKRPEAARKILLVGHYDTVFDAQHPFQTPYYSGEDIASGLLHGPGVADLKGGLVVMLKALEAFERSPYASNIGWEVWLNPDEEIGSPGTGALLQEAAKSARAALVYEPALPDGSLVSTRGGSANYHITISGRSAHSGRALADGRNAISAASALALQAEALMQDLEGVGVNIAAMHGGEALNIVPDKAVLRINIRSAQPNVQQQADARLRALCEEVAATRDVRIQIHGGITRPCKPMTPAMQELMQRVEYAGKVLGQPIHWRATGGVCDGNNIANAGIPVVDTLGVRGDHIHSDKEYMILSSLVERAQLSALILMQMANDA